MGKDRWGLREGGGGERTGPCLCCRAQEQKGAWPLQAPGQLASTSGQWLEKRLAKRSLFWGLGGLRNASGVFRKASRINMVTAET